MRSSEKWKAALAVGCVLILSCCGNEAARNVPEKDLPFSYPLETDMTLTFFTAPLPPEAQPYEETTWGKNNEQATGIRVSYLHPPAGEEDQALKKLIAAHALPDLIRNDWIRYPGGPDQAISDQVILRLNSVLPLHSPHVWNAFQKNPAWEKHYTSESNQYFEYPLAYENRLSSVCCGAIVRWDWLRELSLDVPVTVDDWTEMLRRFKEEKGATAPLSFAATPSGVMPSGFLAGAYGVTTDFYLDENDVVSYGFIKPVFRDFLITLRDWYREGLIDPDIASVNTAAVRKKMLTGDSGAIMGNAVTDIPYLLEHRLSQEYDVIGVTYPVLKPGEKPKFGQGGLGFDDGGSVAISASCRHVEEAARYMDFAYTQEGYRLNTFGVEGIDYLLNAGDPEHLYRPDMNENAADMRVNWQLPSIKTNYWEGIPAYGRYAQQKEALSNFAFTDYHLYALPSLSYQPYESGEMAAIVNKIERYVQEMYLKFMFGDAPIDLFDDYVQTIRNMGIDKVLTAKTEALRRYRER